MNYKFNEEELLSLFYDKENYMRPIMSAPYLKNGYVCATEGHILIRIKAETLSGEYNEIESLNILWPADTCNFIISLQEIETALSSIPQVEEEKQIGKDIECEECEGVGLVEWRYEDKSGRCHYDDCDCPICDGSGYESRARYEKTGRMIPDEKCHIAVRDSVLRVRCISTLMQAMRIIGVDEVRCVHQDIYDPCAFRIDDNIEILIMPCLTEADYRIEGRDAE